MPKFRKKPVVIEAVRWIGTNWSEIYQFASNRLTKNGVDIEVRTLEGNMRIQINDWIIKGVKGEFYLCKPDIFEATYEPVA